MNEAGLRRRLGAAGEAMAAAGQGDWARAEQAALLWLGFAPPQRASGDLLRPLAADARYRRLPSLALAARVSALTGGARTEPPACCAATTRVADGDETGFAALLLPADAPGPHGDPAADRWLLSPLDATRGFVPCGYACEAAIAARRGTLVGRSLPSLRGLLAARLLRLAPGVDLVAKGTATRRGGLELSSLTLLHAPLPGPLLHLVEALVVRRLLAGRELRVLDDAVEVRQGLVFVKMLHPDGARWVDLG